MLNSKVIPHYEQMLWKTNRTFIYEMNPFSDAMGVRLSIMSCLRIPPQIYIAH